MQTFQYSTRVVADKSELRFCDCIILALEIFSLRLKLYLSLGYQPILPAHILLVFFFNSIVERVDSGIVKIGRQHETGDLKGYNHCHKSLAHTHPLSPIQYWNARFVRTPCELALLRFVDNIERVGAGGRGRATQII